MKLIKGIILCIVLSGCGKTPIADFSWSPQNPKAGEEVQFTNLSTDAKEFSWNFGDMDISNESNPKHTYQKSGNYIIDLNATSGLKTDIKTVTIIVTP
ncbi:MAG TPA: PKD domain-containing protein [Bacteroidales bacterium]|nr:PKD domain-containing protein [Paludibacteraceae bacterium]HPT02081.1 PKD domain-containing protein [Bacteroidales bacterium]